MFIEQYRRHPESKAAGPDGLPSTEETKGVLGRLVPEAGEPPLRIGKEVDRLEEADGVDLDAQEAIRRLQGCPQAPLAERLLGVSVRRLRDVLKSHATPRDGLRRAIPRGGLPDP